MDPANASSDRDLSKILWVKRVPGGTIVPQSTTIWFFLKDFFYSLICTNSIQSREALVEHHKYLHLIPAELFFCRKLQKSKIEPVECLNQLKMLILNNNDNNETAFYKLLVWWIYIKDIKTLKVNRNTHMGSGWQRFSTNKYVYLWFGANTTEGVDRLFSRWGWFTDVGVAHQHDMTHCHLINTPPQQQTNHRSIHFRVVVQRRGDAFLQIFICILVLKE